MRVHQMMTRRADQVLAPLDLTFARYELLVRLYFREGSLPLTQLGKELQIHQTSITSLVDRLEKQGLIKRTPHPTDRRSTIAADDAGRAGADRQGDQPAELGVLPRPRPQPTARRTCSSGC